MIRTLMDLFAPLVGAWRALGLCFVAVHALDACCLVLLLGLYLGRPARVEVAARRLLAAVSHLAGDLRMRIGASDGQLCRWLLDSAMDAEHAHSSAAAAAVPSGSSKRQRATGKARSATAPAAAPAPLTARLVGCTLLLTVLLLPLVLTALAITLTIDIIDPEAAFLPRPFWMPPPVRPEDPGTRRDPDLDPQSAQHPDPMDEEPNPSSDPGLRRRRATSSSSPPSRSDAGPGPGLGSGSASGFGSAAMASRARRAADAAWARVKQEEYRAALRTLGGPAASRQLGYLVVLMLVSVHLVAILYPHMQWIWWAIRVGALIGAVFVFDRALIVYES